MDYLDAQTSVRYIGLFQKYYNDNMRTVHSTRSQPAFAEQFIGTFFYKNRYAGCTDQTWATMDRMDSSHTAYL